MRSNVIPTANRTGAHEAFVVYAVDEFSGGESFISALLQDPFSSEAESIRILRRWEGRGHGTRLDIECGGPVLTHYWF